jgi:hypothetical protein
MRITSLGRAASTALAVLALVAHGSNAATPPNPGIVPQQMELVGSINLGNDINAENILIAEGFAYITSRRKGLSIVDCNDTSHPVLISEFDEFNPPGGISDISIRGGYLFAVGGKSGMAIVDIANPKMPTIAGTLALDGYSVSVDVDESYAYIGSDGIKIVDVSDPRIPVLIGNVKERAIGYAWDLAVSGDFAYLAANMSHIIQVVDISDPSSPQLRGKVANTSANAARGVTISGSIAYVAIESDGLNAFDITDPDNPVLVGNVKTSGAIYEVAATDFRAAVPDSRDGLYIVDISNPSEPRHRNHRPLERGLYVDVAIFDGLFFAITKSGRIDILKDLLVDAVTMSAGHFSGTFLQKGKADSSYGSDYFLFIAGGGQDEFPLFSSNPQDAYRFCELSPADVRGQKLQDISKGRLLLESRMAMTANVLVMSDIPRLADFHAKQIAPKDIYQLQEEKDALLTQLVAIHSEFIGELNQLRSVTFVFTKRGKLLEKNYDFDSGILYVDSEFTFLPPCDERVGWKFNKYNKLASTFPLVCPGSTARKIFSRAEGEVGSRTVEVVIEFYGKLGGSKLECVFDTLTPFQLTRVTIRLNGQETPQEIQLERAGEEWRPLIR